MKEFEFDRILNLQMFSKSMQLKVTVDIAPALSLLCTKIFVSIPKFNF